MDKIRKFAEKYFQTLLLLQRAGVAVDTAAYTVEQAARQLLPLLGGDAV